MSKQYIAPITEVVEIETPQLMLTISGEQDGVGTGSGSAGNGTPDLANDRRGRWGNLWEEN